MTATYDGRYSKDCQQECQVGTCSGNDLPGCGYCCACCGGCEVGYHEQQDERRPTMRQVHRELDTEEEDAETGAVWVGGCTCNAASMGFGSSHESYCGWDNP